MTAELQELLDKQALYELVVRYCRAVDRRDGELLVSCYHPDAIDEHGSFSGNGGEFLGHCLAEGSMNLEKLPGPNQHSITNAVFDVRGDVAYGETYVETRFNVGGEIQRGLGRYVDRFERRDGEWRIAHRRVVLEHARPGTDLSAFVRGFRDRRDPSYERDENRAALR